MERLIEARRRAREAGDWAEAARIRKDLEARGIVLEDRDGKTVWRCVCASKLETSYSSPN